MILLAPSRLLLLGLVVALGAAYVVLQLRRRHYAVRFTNLALLDSVAPKRPGWRRHVAAIGGLLAISAMVIGLARPARDEKVPRREAVVMLAVDVSASMEATDVSPTRLVAAKAAAADFVAQIPDGFQVGLVAFNKRATVLATPTIDHQAVLQAIDNLTTGEGTAGGEGLYAALDSIASVLPENNDSASDQDKLEATVVMLSDGKTTVGRPIEQAAAAAKDAGVPVSTIAFGTQSATLELQGEIVPVPADPETMRAVADTTDGTFFEAVSASQLKSVYEDIQGRVGFVTEQREVGRVFLAFAMAVMVLATAASMFWSARFL